MCAASPTSTGLRAGWREKIRLTPPLQWHFREKTRPASAKTPNLGQFERAGRTFSRFHDLPATQGELFRACRRRPASALPISTPGPTGVEGARGAEVPGRSAGGRRHNPAPNKFRMQFPHDTNRCTLKNRRISTIRFQHLKYTQGNCMRNCWMTERPGCGARGRRQGMAGLRADVPGRPSHQAPLVWRVPEGPGGAWLRRPRAVAGPGPDKFRT